MIIYIVFHSEGGHVHKLAEAVADGARSVEGATVKMFQTGETVTTNAIEQNDDMKSKKSFQHIPVITASELALADAVIFGTPAVFGMMASQLRTLLDQAETLWAGGALLGKVGSVFTSTATHQGGQEMTLASVYVALLHLGMIIVGVPYCENRLLSVEAISGRTPYGASTAAGSEKVHQPNVTEIGIARFQGQHVAEMTRFLVRGRELCKGNQ